MSAPNQRIEQFKDYQHKNELLSTKYWRRAKGEDRGANERLLGGYVQRWMYWVLWCFPKLWNYFFPISQELRNKAIAADKAKAAYDYLSLSENNGKHDLSLDLESVPTDSVINKCNEILRDANTKQLGNVTAKQHDILNIVGLYSNPNDFRKLNQTCSLLYDKAVLLLQSVAFGKEEEAKTYLESSPELLLNKTATVIDYSGKTITGLTPFQAALCAGDVEMCEMMRPYFEKLDNCLEQMQRQYDEIFPSGIDAHTQTQKQAAYDFDWIYQKIKGAPDDQVKDALKLTGASFTRTDNLKETSTKDLTKQQRNSITLVESLNRFREEFDLLSKSEKIFNPYHLLNAFKLYRNKFDALINWDQRDVFWQQIIGYCQRNLPACYAQAITQGIYFILVENESLARTLNFRCNNNKAFYPIFVRGCSGLGFNWAAAGPSLRRGGPTTVAAGHRPERPERGWRGRPGVLAPWGRLCQTKTSGMEHLRISINTQNKVLLNYL